jgi:hypothetical protein
MGLAGDGTHRNPLSIPTFIQPSAISHVAISSAQEMLTSPNTPTLRVDELHFVELDPVPVTTPESPFSYH